jgi:hypothetical protein
VLRWAVQRTRMRLGRVDTTTVWCARAGMNENVEAWQAGKAGSTGWSDVSPMEVTENPPSAYALHRELDAKCTGLDNALNGKMGVSGDGARQSARLAFD